MIDATLLLPPAFAIGAWRARKNGITTRLGIELALVGYAVALIALTIFPIPIPRALAPSGHPLPARVAIQAQPLVTIALALDRGLGSAQGRVLVGNVAAFVPLGFLPPILWPRLRGIRATLAITVLASAAIEAGQFVLSAVAGYRYRSPDVDDVIVNAVGGILGYLGYAVVRRLAVAHARTRSAVRLDPRGLATVDDS